MANLVAIFGSQRRRARRWFEELTGLRPIATLGAAGAVDLPNQRMRSTPRSLRARRARWFGLGVLLVLVAIDRAAWTLVAQWREDQGTNLWLGYIGRLRRALPPVGLLSSANIPNPNGVPMLGAVLSLLPSLFWVSLVCSMAQALAVIWAAAELSLGSTLTFSCLALPSLACVFLRGASIEFWNQWLFITVNALFIALLARDLRRHHPLHHVGIFLLILLSPALYLLGVVNSLVFAVGWGVLIVRRRRVIRLRAPATLASFGLMFGAVAIALWLTWLPFLHAVDWHALSDRDTPAPSARIAAAFAACKTVPAWILAAHPPDLDMILHSDSRINGEDVDALARLASWLYRTQLAVFGIALATVIVRALIRKRRPPRLTPVWLLLLTVLAYAASPLLGGFSWHEGHRSDQSLEFLGWIMAVIFGVPAFGGSLGRLRPWLSYATLIVALSYASVAAACGVATVKAHLAYRGSIVSDADVPLIDKENVLQFVADDWHQRSESKRIPIFYELVGAMGWVTGHGEEFQRYVPESTFTIGRALDWELSRRFHLRNAHEGEQTRHWNHDRYVISYAHARPPRYLPRRSTRTVFFGRLRLSIFSENPSGRAP
jgi:hypothetical protein